VLHELTKLIHVALVKRILLISKTLLVPFNLPFVFCHRDLCACGHKNKTTKQHNKYMN